MTLICSFLFLMNFFLQRNLYTVGPTSKVYIIVRRIIKTYFQFSYLFRMFKNTKIVYISAKFSFKYYKFMNFESVLFRDF